MRQSKMLLPTLREVPSEAEIVSHQLMLRAGMIRQLAAGVYTYLPLGYRVLRKIEGIVREEMERTGAQEILSSALQPAELWIESGRWDDYGPELMRLHDRHERPFALGPTHEEVFTSLVRNEVRSYKKLPLVLYQIQTKFRDERRPRFGMMRAREFIMKDAYSFDTDWAGLDLNYRSMYDAYTRIFDRCGLDFRAVEADAGTIGGEGGTHEFMVLSDVGEDTIVVCRACDYSANLEKARSGPLTGQVSDDDIPPRTRMETPGARTIEDLVSHFGMEPDRILKTLVYEVDGKPVAVVLRGDHTVNEIKLKGLYQAKTVELMSEEQVRKLVGAGFGSVSPIDVSLEVIVDDVVADIDWGYAGANEDGVHYKYVQPGRDFNWARQADLRNAAVNDPCPHCGNPLLFYRGIEVGHVFKLGMKYSEPLRAKYLDENGQEQLMIMGCYGIGISRVAAAIIEQHSDENGICWPASVAPYLVHIIPVSIKDEVQMAAAEELYNRLIANGVEVLLDNRDERPGVKFKDSDLIGIPVRVTVGNKIGDGLMEVKFRSTGEVHVVSVDEAYHMAAGYR